MNSHITRNVASETQKVATTVGTNGYWKVYHQPMSAGGPYTLTAASDGQILKVSDVLCGDVWLCSGQSNMQMPVKECAAREQQATLASHSNLRLCTVGKGWNPKPQFSADIQWRICTPDSAQNFSAIAYFFASELLKDKTLTDVPIGVIDSSFGGTACEGWIPQFRLGRIQARRTSRFHLWDQTSHALQCHDRAFGRCDVQRVVWDQVEK